MESVFAETASSGTYVPLAATLDQAVPHRRNYCFGLWAASELEIAGSAAEDYAKDVAGVGDRVVGDERLVRLIDVDMAAYRRDVNLSTIWQRLNRCEFLASWEAAGMPNIAVMSVDPGHDTLAIHR